MAWENRGQGRQGSHNTLAGGLSVFWGMWCQFLQVDDSWSAMLGGHVRLQAGGHPSGYPHLSLSLMAE